MRIHKTIFEQIVIHARREAPVEACGYIAAKDGVLLRAYELTNTDHSPEHFTFDPKAQFAGVKSARNDGLEAAAVYHSHPASPARPSKEDISLAFDADKLYVIVSLLGGRETVKGFWIRNGQVTEEILEVVHGDRI